MQATPWWKQSVVYQIYPRSFCDGNGDGIGDIPGIISKLDYLKELGVDVVWLSPVYDSPNDDNGYDIRDYRSIHPEFGCMADFDAMLAGMHARGIRLVMDLVVNHSSDEHRWFREARSARDNPYHDYYIWRPPGPDGAEPNNWASCFSGPAWTFNPPTGEYYLHLFSKKQPDLNWDNPKVREEVYALMRFWLDKGVDGFRMDVINLIAKVAGLPDAPVTAPDMKYQFPWDVGIDRSVTLGHLGEMKRQVLDAYDVMTVGETPNVSVEDAVSLTHHDSGPLNMVFQFEHMGLDSGHGKWDLKPLALADLKATFTRWQHGLAESGWNSLYLSNHDQPRPVSRFGDDRRYRVESAKMLATLLHFQQGTPYIYQGEEIGMTNVAFPDIADYRDIETLNMYREAVARGRPPAELLRAIHAKGRDNARTPMQWDAGPYAGFSTVAPWIGVNPNHIRINVAAQLEDPDSVLAYYRRLIRLRHAMPVMVHGQYALVGSTPDTIYAFTRSLGDTRLLVVLNFSNQETAFDFPERQGSQEALATGTLLIGNYPPRSDESATPLRLRPYEARVYHGGPAAGLSDG